MRMRYGWLWIGFFLANAALAGDLLYSPSLGGSNVARYYSGDLSGLHAYWADLRVRDPKTALALLPAWELLQQKEDRAVTAATMQGLAGGFLFVGSFSF